MCSWAADAWTVFVNCVPVASRPSDSAAWSATSANRVRRSRAAPACPEDAGVSRLVARGRDAERGSKAEGDRGQDGNRDREECDPMIQRHRERNPAGDEGQRPSGQEQAQARRGHRENHRLGEDLANDPPARGAERRGAPSSRARGGSTGPAPGSPR